MPRDDKVFDFQDAVAKLKEATDDRPPEFSDDSLALRFAAKHGSELRYVAAWGQWMIWLENTWTEDDTLSVFDDARTVARAAALDCKKPKAASAIKSAKTIAAIEKLSRYDRSIAAKTEWWDHGIERINPRRRS